MKRDLLIAMGLAIVIAGAAGCATEEETRGDRASDSGSASASSAAPTTSASPTVAPGTANVNIDGQTRTGAGPVVCETNAGKFSIAIGEPLTGIIIGIEPDGSVVHGVGLGDFNGVVMSFTEGVPGNDAKATKQGNTYKIKGTATGSDNANQTVSKPFEIEVTCP